MLADAKQARIHVSIRDIMRMVKLYKYFKENPGGQAILELSGMFLLLSLLLSHHLDLLLCPLYLFGCSLSHSYTNLRVFEWST